jgi:hypothetical protein
VQYTKNMLATTLHLICLEHRDSYWVSCRARVRSGVSSVIDVANSMSESLDLSSGKASLAGISKIVKVDMLFVVVCLPRLQITPWQE